VRGVALMMDFTGASEVQMKCGFELGSKVWDKSENAQDIINRLLEL